MTTGTKRCNRCHETKPTSEFYPRSGRARGVLAHCKVCAAAKHREWYERNKARVTAKGFRGPSRKTCAVCKVTKGSRQFMRSVVMPDGLDAACRDCRNTYARAYSKQWREGKRDWRHGDHIHRVYRMTREQYAALVDAQHGVCAICGKVSGKRLQVDHCHITGKTRALLCHVCNTQLGRLEERIVKHPQFMRYIEQYGGASLRAHNDQGA